MEQQEKKYPQTFKELFEGTGIEATIGEDGKIHYNFKALKKENGKTKEGQDIGLSTEAGGENGKAS